MSKIIESESQLDEVLEKHSRIFIIFYASWCTFCQRFLPIFEKYSRNKDDKFYRIMTDLVPACEDEYSIEVVPTVIYFEDGRTAKRLDGIHGVGLTENRLSAMISSCESGGGKDTAHNE